MTFRICFCQTSLKNATKKHGKRSFYIDLHLDKGNGAIDVKEPKFGAQIGKDLDAVESNKKESVDENGDLKKDMIGESHFITRI